MSDALCHKALPPTRCRTRPGSSSTSDSSRPVRADAILLPPAAQTRSSSSTQDPAPVSGRVLVRGLPPESFFIVDAESGCWNCRTVSDRGYGSIRVPPFTTRRAHRIFYELFIGPIPPGLELDHACRNKRCINPQHLEPVPHHVNVLRGDGVAALNAAKECCVRGHAFTADNTLCSIERGRPRRRCVACLREHDRRRRGCKGRI